MIRIITVISILVFFSFSEVTFAKDKKNVKFRQGKRIDFASLLIEGQKKKADYSVVTGNLGEIDMGLLKLREDFNDLMANDLQEEIQ